MEFSLMSVVFVMFGLPVISLAVYSIFRAVLDHRVKMAEIHSRIHKDSSESPALRARCEALEKRCEKLEEQLIAVHADLADERRELDRKLATMLPDIPVSDSSAARNRDEQVKTIQ